MFTEEEQWATDLAWYAVDSGGRIAYFTTGGFKLLPPSVAKSKKILEKLDNYFSNLPFSQGANYIACSDLPNNLDERLITDRLGYIKLFAEMSSRGLYAYDSDSTFHEKSYFRVTIPTIELRIDDLPKDVKIILKHLQLNGINFAQNSLVSEKITSNL